MEFAEFILAHDGDDLGRLALARDKYAPEVEDFDLALTTLEVRRKLRYKVPEWYAEPSLRYPFRLSGEQCSSSETASYKASLAGQGNVADLTGGLGVDSWAFAGCAKEVL
ncbi:MAG: SAM-dependent methyltransferase, partial [Bacteroidales bacterium]|nr:SAM-dependent methyltransferase [Bacteroidales bacterium]